MKIEFNDNENLLYDCLDQAHSYQAEIETRTMGRVVMRIGHTEDHRLDKVTGCALVGLRVVNMEPIEDVITIPFSEILSIQIL